MGFPERISRRTLLRGLGVSIALPALESMGPARAQAASASAWPTRSVFIFTPNGMHLPEWTPTQVGATFELPPILQAFEPFREKMTILSGLALDAGRAHGDGPGDHARAASTFLTGAHPVKTAGFNIRVGTSIDQLIASQIGQNTRFSSLELGLESGLNAGGCDSGYSCAYSSNVSWRSPTTPAAKETNPKLLFDRLFGGDSAGQSAEARARRDLFQTSVLDFALEDARALQKRISGSDRQKLDEYFTGVREIEARVRRFSGQATAKAPKLDLPDERPKDFVEHYRLMADLMVLALKTDMTRVMSFMVGNAGSNRSYKMIGVAEGHHSLSHHGNDPQKVANIAKINRLHAEQLAYLLKKLDGVREGDGSLLDHCQLLYGSGLGDGNRHNHDGLPIALFGRAGQAFKPSQHVLYDKETPLCNLYLTMLRNVGINAENFGDSTGILPELLA